ncbi:MAG: prepilin-type N-terminal cleavage/methylation domain-containing protein [Candidatus Wildermuthbacteria bacterium]|nr:prepilin-type N-terminal cleavage/methylation domain-containing protein [Candidatus Wildermuthbacteria bacterium]
MANKFEQRKSPEGFTLVEILLSLALIAIMSVAVASFVALLFGVKAKHQAILEVEDQGLQAMQYINQRVRNADDINAPNRGDNSSTLSLDVPDLSRPVVFGLAGDALYVQEGTAPQILLTSPRVEMSELNFQNLSVAGDSGIIRIEFTLSYRNMGNRGEYEYSQTFYGSSSLRP